jgi:hypothetical protein
MQGNLRPSRAQDGTAYFEEPRQHVARQDELESRRWNNLRREDRFVDCGSSTLAFWRCPPLEYAASHALIFATRPMTRNSPIEDKQDLTATPPRRRDATDGQYGDHMKSSAVLRRSRRWERRL